MTIRYFECGKCGVKIQVTRPPVILTFDDGRKSIYDYVPEKPEYCPNGHAELIEQETDYDPVLEEYR